MAQKRTRLEYSSVIDPAATLPRAEKVRVLVRATARPKADVEKALSAAPQASLLDLKRAVDAAAAGKRVKVPKLSGAAGPIEELSYVKANPAARAAGLSRMLLEAEARSKAQVEFEKKISTEPPAKKPRTGSWACAACLDDGLPSSKVVVCPMLVKYHKGMSGPVFGMLGGPKQHVYCCSCLRSYLLGSRLHQGDLNKMMCPGCENHARAFTYMFKVGQKYYDPHYTYDNLSQSAVSRVVGPVDELRMHDLRMQSGRKVTVPPALKKALRGCGAKACPDCGSYCEHKGGCPAVICANCTRIFNFERAKA